jgi:hypothetical protein
MQKSKAILISQLCGGTADGAADLGNRDGGPRAVDHVGRAAVKHNDPNV